MASQNIDPSSTNSSTSKQRGKSNVLPGGLHSVTQRLQQDLMTLMSSGEKFVSAFPDGDNLFRWKATISGAEDTAYAGLDYKLEIEFPDRYPFVPPKVKFITPCYHPNVDNQGAICLDILKDKWSALMDVRTVLLSIQLLLSEPNNKDPLNPEAAKLWENKTEFGEMVEKKYREQVGKFE
ncbi:ubiquitin-conjugating enzyme E2 C-like [Xenia sp. Carnegie-2017]|uniref:ubiquitin-conjugating enzyme E2 C-like n=1 Tax=Xenia sp. Carnegie-2017 TaxID=2897299 RepID=UPI001F043E78|nr:ubiquitin-conjugating enzyme E2 C-like [Xenia sp. Carnegie-2017]